MGVDWQVATSLYTDLALDALKMAIWRRRHTGSGLAGLTHHSDRGVQYRAIRYTERLADEAAVASVGFKVDSYDNALAEAFNSLFRAELIRNKGPWTSINDVEIAVAEYVDWFNQRRLHGELGHVTPAEHGAAHYAAKPPAITPENQLTHSPQNPVLDTVSAAREAGDGASALGRGLPAGRQRSAGVAGTQPWAVRRHPQRVL
ncbi:transposase [Streptomyces sp. NPDC102467]|uniref:transposase n=1 Tax=Streptomyces sp. NPDC102467 TaxID=3366179 RepID=UPI00380616C8